MGAGVPVLEAAARRRVGLDGLVGPGGFLGALVFYVGTEDAYALPKAVTLVGVTVGASVLALVRQLPTSRREIDPLVVLLGCYLALTGVATIASVDPQRSLVGEPFQYQGLVATLAYAATLLLGRSIVLRGENPRAVVGWLIAAGVLAAGYGIAQQLGMDPFWDTLYKGRIFSTFGQANNLAAYLVLVWPVAIAGIGFGWTEGSREWRRRISVAARGLTIAILGLAIALTMSRGGYLGAATALLTLVVLAVRRAESHSLRRLRPVAIVGAACLLVLLIGPGRSAIGAVASRAATIADPAESSAAAHLDLWAVGARIALDHPLLGVGPDAYALVFDRYRDAVLPAERAAVLARFRPESPHSVPLAIAAGVGLGGLGLYATIVLVVLGRGILALGRSGPDRRWILGGLIAGSAGHLVTDLFMTAEPAGSWTFWLMLGLVAGLAARPPRATLRTAAGWPTETGRV